MRCLAVLELTASNAIRNDLQHPNEYIRGATLRFLQKIRESEILEPLIPTIRSCMVRVPPLVTLTRRNTDTHLSGKTPSSPSSQYIRTTNTSSLMPLNSSRLSSLP